MEIIFPLVKCNIYHGVRGGSPPLTHSPSPSLHPSHTIQPTTRCPSLGSSLIVLIAFVVAAKNSLSAKKHETHACREIMGWIQEVMRATFRVFFPVG